MKIHKLCLYFACILAYTQGLAIITNWPRHHRLPHSSRPRGRGRTLWQRTGPGRRSAPTTASRAPRPAVPAPPGRQGAPCQFPRGRGGRGSTFPRRRRSLSRLRSRCCACVVGVPEMTVFGGGLRRTRRSRSAHAHLPLAVCWGRSLGGGGGGPEGGHERVRGRGVAVRILGRCWDPERQQRQSGEDRHVLG